MSSVLAKKKVLANQHDIQVTWCNLKATHQEFKAQLARGQTHSKRGGDRNPGISTVMVSHRPITMVGQSERRRLDSVHWPQLGSNSAVASLPLVSLPKHFTLREAPYMSTDSGITLLMAAIGLSLKPSIRPWNLRLSRWQLDHRESLRRKVLKTLREQGHYYWVLQDCMTCMLPGWRHWSHQRRLPTGSHQQQHPHPLVLHSLY
jgi:hypothetical protein